MMNTVLLYGLAIECPLKDFNQHCPILFIRNKVSLRDKQLHIANMNYEEKIRLIRMHTKCLQKREKVPLSVRISNYKSSKLLNEGPMRDDH